jgi:GrpB-like predicted nucleotidyltransferase (UPF0157 family)
VLSRRNRGILKLDEVEVVDYDPNWKDLFRIEKEELEKRLGPTASEVHHIGSTAVPGLAAKPVIDIMLAASFIDDLEDLKRKLSPLGYTYVPQVDPNRFFFRKGTPRSHHLHVVRLGTWTYFSHLWFNDYLIDHAATAEEYACLKMILARRHKSDRDAYLKGKEGMIAMVLERAVRERLIDLASSA